MTDNNRPVRPQSSGQPSRFGDLNDSRPAQRGAAPAGNRAYAGQRPAASPRPATSPRPAQRPAAQAPRPAANPRPKAAPLGVSGSRLPRGFVPLLGVCVAIIALGLVLQGLMPGGFSLGGTQDKAERPVAAQVSEIHGEGPVRLNEIMSANGGVLVDANGATPDWVEVANIGNRPVNLQGYILAKSAKAGNVFVFPDVILQAGECAIVYADSTLQAELGEELHAPFRLSSGGDVLMLFNTADVAVDTVNIPSLAENTVYARTGTDSWEVSNAPTPGQMNTEENYRAMNSVSGDSPVQIVEVMSSSATYAPDENGVCHDYVILKNVSGGDVDLGGWYLSDTQQLARMWRIPDGVSLPAGGTLRVHCSGLNRSEDPAHLHTNFKLSSEGEQVVLSNASGQPMDLVTFDLLKSDTAIVRGSDGSWSAGAPTAEKAVPTQQAAA